MGQGSFPALKTIQATPRATSSKKPHPIYEILIFLRHNPIMDTGDDIPEDKLLAMPEANTGNLSSRRSILLHDRELAEIAAEREGTARPMHLFPWDDPREIHRTEDKHRRDLLAYEEAMHEITERQDRLLASIEAEEARITARRQEIEDHALRLRDGRRVYVDGDRYRDGQGILLTGADEAEAAHQHEYRPDASTWAQKYDIDHRFAAAEKLKNEVLADKQDGQGTPDDHAARMDGYEKEFADKVEAKAAGPVVDYGSADDYSLSAVPAFTAAADPVSRETKRELTEDDSGTQDAKKPPQPFGGGGMKLG
jgi:hypothetical protein